MSSRCTSVPIARRQRHRRRASRCSRAARAANVAAWLARAGVEVTLIGRVGDDAMAEVALSGLDGVHLHVTRDPERSTGTCVVLVAPGGERTMLPDPGANDALAATDLPEFDGDILHVSGYALLRPGSRAAALEAIERARDAGHEDQRRSRQRGAAGQRPDLPRARRADRPAAAQRRRGRTCSGRRSSVPGARDQARRDGRDVDGRDRDDRRARAWPSTTWSTPRAPATRSPRGSSASGRDHRRRRWRRARGWPRRRSSVPEDARHDAHPDGLHGQHLPLADGRGRDALARARGRPRGRDRRSTARAPAAGTSAIRPTAARPRPRRPAAITLEGAARQLTPRDFDDYDLLLAMDRENLRGMRAIAPVAEAARKVRLLRAYDPRASARPTSTCPTRTTAARTASRLVLDQVEAACRGPAR